MTDDKKIWIVEAGDVLDVMTPEKKQPATVQVNRRYQEPQVPPARPAQTETVKRRAKPVAPAKSSLQFAPLVALTYLLGPLAVLLNPQARSSRALMATAGLSVAATTALVLARFGGLVRPDKPLTVWLWVALVAVAVFGGFTAWSRAIHLLGRHGIPHPSKLPYWLRRSWVISLLGLIAPGSGILLSGRSDRAAVALWLLAPPAAAMVIVVNGLALWRHHEASGWLANSGAALESVLVVAAICVGLGLLAYVAQALEGMRQLTVEPGLKSRVKGDYYALAVMAAVVALIVVANPAQMAHQLDIGVDALRAEGMREIPLQLTLAARQLDPAKAEYSLQALELYAELERPEAAAALRTDLDRDLGTYVALVQKETVAEFGLARNRPAAEPQRPATRPAAVERAVAKTAAADMAKNDVVEPQAQPESAGQTAMDPAAALAGATLMGSLFGQFGLEQAIADADSAPAADAAPAKKPVARAMGLPFGGLPLSEISGQDGAKDGARDTASGN